MGAEPSERSAAATYNRFTRAVHGILPRWLSWIPATYIGFAILSLTTFILDVILLTLLFRGVGLPYPVAVTIGYGTASVVNFLLNKWLNFRAPGDLAKQSSKQVVVIASNYLIWVLAFSWLLETIGVQFQVSRILAACVEGLYIYLMMRLWVFPRRTTVHRLL